MSSSARVRRIAAAAGASGLIALSLAGPAAARPDPGTGGTHEGSSTTVVEPSPNRSVAQVLRIDDDALEVLQLGAGVAAGLVLGGAGALLVSRRGHSPIHPAATA